MTIDLAAKEIAIEHIRIRARLRRLRQVLTLEDADVLIALRELRQQDPITAIRKVQ